MLRDAENAKFGLKAQGKASSSKENEASFGSFVPTRAVK